MRLQATVVRADPHPSGLQLRVVLRSQRTGWVQFTTVDVVLDDLDEYMRRYLISRLEDREPVDEPDEPLF